MIKKIWKLLFDRACYSYWGKYWIIEIYNPFKCKIEIKQWLSDGLVETRLWFVYLQYQEEGIDYQSFLD